MSNPDDDHLKKIAKETSQEIVGPFIEGLNGIIEKVSGNEEGDLTALKTSNKDSLLSALNEVKDQADKAVTTDASQVLDLDEKKVVRDKIDVYSKDEIGDYKTRNFSKILEEEINKLA